MCCNRAFFLDSSPSTVTIRGQARCWAAGTRVIRISMYRTPFERPTYSTIHHLGLTYLLCAIAKSKCRMRATIDDEADRQHHVLWRECSRRTRTRILLRTKTRSHRTANRHFARLSVLALGQRTRTLTALCRRCLHRNLRQTARALTVGLDDLDRADECSACTSCARPR